MRDSDQFTAHADRCDAEAAAATLDNVRDRSLRASATWRDMAERSLRMETARAEREARTPVAATQA
ncbi:hypothetical protein SPAN111604_09165 [Sphingomonas antarctica]|uniref:hypothetical protein n=1 Tax=Sphingomonas antarctica TaxID=2040274 RepID=UPI0039EB30CE